MMMPDSADDVDLGLSLDHKGNSRCTELNGSWRFARSVQMSSNCLYSANDIKKAYEKTRDHVYTKHLIVKYSTNPEDVRNNALEGLNLSRMTHVLELGCGYGAFTKGLVGALGHGAEIIGIDMVPENGPLFLSTVASMGYRGKFVHDRADLIYTMGDGRFDLIISSYSLYFFPHLIPEIARILNPGGVFVAITHSEYSLREVLKLIPSCMCELGLMPLEELSIERLLRTFSMENGCRQLQPHFGRIETTVYRNALLFPDESMDDCIDYLEMKKALLFKDIEDRYPSYLDEIKLKFYKGLRMQSDRTGFLSITKDDAIFHCFNPKRTGDHGRKS
jgi:SAM-dependent methyltransferase